MEIQRRGISHGDKNARLVPAIDLVLLFPAVLFLMAVYLRQFPALQYLAQEIVTWYSTRLWTLWVLLIALPLTALIGGLAALLRVILARPGDLPTNQSNVSRPLIAAETLTAGLILAIVFLHMLAN